MSERISLDLMARRISELQQENENLRIRSNTAGLKSGGGDGTSDGMNLVTYRLDNFEKRSDAADARMARVEDKLNAIQTTLAGLATKESIRHWGIAVAAIVIATGMGVGAILLQSSANQLAAFQAGLSALQVVVAAHDAQSPPSAAVPQPTKH